MFALRYEYTNPYLLTDTIEKLVMPGLMETKEKF